MRTGPYSAKPRTVSRFDPMRRSVSRRPARSPARGARMAAGHRSSIRPSRSEQPITMRMAVGRYSLCHEGSPGSGSLVARMADWSGVGLRLFGGALVEQTEDQPDRRLVVTLAECLSGGGGVGEPFRPWPRSDKRWDAVSHQHPVGPQARRPAIAVGERMDLHPLHLHEGSGGRHCLERVIALRNPPAGIASSRLATVFWSSSRKARTASATSPGAAPQQSRTRTPLSPGHEVA
jgi:hypothetical protein